MLPAGDGAVAAGRRGQQEQGLLATRGPKPKTQGDQETCDLPCFTRDDPDECRSTDPKKISNSAGREPESGSPRSSCYWNIQPLSSRQSGQTEIKIFNNGNPKPLVPSW